MSKKEPTLNERVEKAYEDLTDAAASIETAESSISELKKAVRAARAAYDKLTEALETLGEAIEVAENSLDEDSFESVMVLEGVTAKLEPVADVLGELTAINFEDGE